MRFWSVTNQGERACNEDSFGTWISDDCACFAVADGLGGHGNGELASKMAIQVLENLFSTASRHPDFLLDAASAAHDQIWAYKTSHGLRRTMMTTLAACRVMDCSLEVLHVGDSRCYLFRDGSTQWMTSDHSVPQMLLSLGEIMPEEIRGHPDRNRILRALGMECEALSPTISPIISLKPGDALLLCTDGFWEPVREQAMCDSLREAGSVQDWLKIMERLIPCSPTSNGDNYTAIGVWYQ